MPQSRLAGVEETAPQIVGGAQYLTISGPVSADRHPAAVYLAGLASRPRRAMRQALGIVSGPPMSRAVGSLLLYAMSLLWGGTPAGAAAPLATVQAASGPVAVQRHSSRRSEALAVRGALYARDVVSTGAAARATILFSDGSQIRLNVRTDVEITEPGPVGRGKKSLLRVLGGEVWARLQPGRAIETRSAIAGVRGTEIDLLAAPDGTTTLTVLDGEVDFFNERGTVVVRMAQQSTARVGQAPSAPVVVANPALIIEWTVDLERAILRREPFFIAPEGRKLKGEIPKRRERVEREPESVEARRELGDLLFDTGDLEGALREWRAASRLAPGTPDLEVRIGHALLDTGRLEEAEAAFRAAGAAANDGPYAPALTGRAWLQLVRNRPADAERIAERAIATAPQSAEARLVHGLSLLRQPGKQSQGLAALRAGLTGEPEALRYQLHSWLALGLLGSGDLTGALREAQIAAGRVPGSTLARGNLALVHFFTGDLRTAEREARAAVELDPEAAPARVALAQMLLGQNRVDEAVRVAARSVALDPRLPQARYMLGVGYAQQRDYRHASRELQESLQLAPDFLPAASALARVYNNMGRLEQAEALLQDMRTRHPGSSAVLAALGQTYYEQGRYANATESYREAIRIEPGSALAHADLARVLFDQNQLAQAINAAREAVRLAPEIAQYHALLGRIYKFSGLNSQAERELRAALALDPQNSLALAMLALTLTGSDLRIGNISFAQAFALDPAISRYLLRGGIDTDLTAGAGPKERYGFLFHRGIAADGRLHHLNRLRYGHDDDDRPNGDSDLGDFIQTVTHVPNPRTNLFGWFHYLGSERGLPGSRQAPDRDDRAHFSYFEGGIISRHELRPGTHLWLSTAPGGGFADAHNPRLNSLFLPNPYFPIPRAIREQFPDGLRIPVDRVDYTNNPGLPPAVEARLDTILNRGARFPAVLSLGAWRLFGQETALTLGVRDPALPQQDLGEGTFREELQSTVLFTQFAQRFHDRLALTAQLRYARQDSTGSVTTTVPGLGPDLGRFSSDVSHLLPSLVLNYLPDRRTTVRLSANRRWTPGVSPVLVPAGVLLTSEAGSQPGGLLADQFRIRADAFNASQTYATPETMQLLQLDLERYLSARNYLKLYFFHTTASNVRIGGIDLTGTGASAGLPALDAPQLTQDRWRATGAGMRFERSLTRNLFATLGLTFRRTRSQAPGTPFDREVAPYEPGHLATLTLDYISFRGQKAALRVRHLGSYFADAGGAGGRRPRFPAATYVDLRLAHEPTVFNEFFVIVTNLFNRSEIRFNGFPADERRVLAGITRRF